MPFDNSYNRGIADHMRQVKERQINHLRSQNMEQGFDDEDVFKGSGISRSGNAMGYNERTGSYERELGGNFNDRINGSGRVSYEQSQKNHEEQSVYGAGIVGNVVPDQVGNMEPAKGHGIGHGLNVDNDDMHGAGFFDDFADGFMSVFKPAMSVISTVAPLVKGLGKKRGRPCKSKEGGTHLIVDVKPHLQLQKKISGEGFWSDFADGFMSVVGPVAKIAESVVPLVKGLGKKRGRPSKKGGNMGKQMAEGIRMEKDGRQLLTKPQLAGDSMNGGAKTEMKGLENLKDVKTIAGDKDIEKAPKIGKGKRTNKRAEIVKKIMKERNIKSLAEASKIVKAEGLYKK